mgnify:CR=1 FL=1
MSKQDYFLIRLQRYLNNYWIETYCNDEKYTLFTDNYLKKLKEIFKKAISFYRAETRKYGESDLFLYERAKLEGFRLRLYNILKKFYKILIKEDCDSNDRARYFLTCVNTITNELT